MSPETQLELKSLLSFLCDGALSEAEQERLEELLEADAECRLLYLEYLDLHAQLLVHPGSLSERMQRPEEQSDSAATSLAATSGRQPRRAAQIVKYVGVACVSLAASVLAQFLWWHPQPSASKREVATETGNHRSSALTGYVATLMQTVDCVWEGGGEGWRPGSRFLPGELRLGDGLARIRFDSGADLIVQGPARLHLTSSTAAAVLHGKVVFRTAQPATPFDLHTPHCTLLDMGTEYAVAVEADREEIQVFEGEVQRVPNPAPGGGEPEYLKAGEARRYERAQFFAGAPDVFDPDRFVRGLPPGANVPAADLAAGLLAYEGFDYADPDWLRSGMANGGSGWAGPWTAGLVRSFKMDPQNLATFNARESLTRSGSTVPSIGGSFEYAGFAVHHRRLATPVRLDTDGVYYLSFLIRRAAGSIHEPNAVSLILRTTEEYQSRMDPRKWLTFGVAGSNQLHAQVGKTYAHSCLPLVSGRTYLLVAKIVTSRATADQMFLRLYRPAEPIGREEPDSWTVVAPPFESDLVFDWLAIQVSGKSRQAIDEIRLGTTWSSVTAPWLPAANAGKEVQP